MTVAAIVLAAGASRRMGEPKPLIPWGGTTLLRWELDELKRSQVDDIVVVTGCNADDIRRSLGEGSRYCVFNQLWPQGRATSLAVGARALLKPGRARPESIVVMNVDQPTRHDIIDRLIRWLRDGNAEVVQPSYLGQAGHPVVLRGTLLEELAQAKEHTLGLRGVLAIHQPMVVPMDDEPVVRLDLDTPDALESARQLLGVAG